MRVSFYTNFLTHHQLPFCLEMYKKYGDDFKFVSTVKINEERLSLGYKDMDNDYPFVLKAYESEEKYKEAMKLALDSDVVIMGSTDTDEYITERLKQDKLTFRYYARIFYKGIFSIFDFKNLKIVYNKHFKYRKNKNLYLLCSSGYGPNDFNKLGMYIDKCFKWGYFPETKIYDEKELMLKKENDTINIVWVGRFIKGKHPETVVRLARRLKKNNYEFHIKMIGNGILFDKIKSQIEKYNLEKEVELVGSISSDKVRKYMEDANISLCTSDKTDRAPVVVNETMNSGCALIVYKGVGGVPFLIKNNNNGYAYSNFRDLYNKTIELINDKEKRESFSLNAYRTMANTWNVNNATRSLDMLINSIINKTENPIKDGPASNAYPFKSK